MAAKPGIELSENYERALLYGLRAHEGQYRKGNRAPYFSHPMAVSSYVMEYGGDEEQAIAALLHDTIEDCDVSETELQKEFGERVATLVLECTEPLSEKITSEKRTYTWQERKDAYLALARNSSDDALLIILCDKYHNLHSLWRDLEYRGEAAWGIFHKPKDKFQWYYFELETVFKSRGYFHHKRSSGLVQAFSDLRAMVFAETS